MRGEEGVAGTLALSENALELLRRHGIAPSPPNYELWFCYAEQANADLVAALDQAVKEGRAQDRSFAQLLHAQFFGPGVGEVMDEVGSQLTQEVSKLARALESAGSDTRDYGKALKIASDELGRSGLDPRLKTILATVTTATHAMEARNKTLEQQLTSSIGEVQSLRDRMEAVRKESLSDALTGLANRRSFDERIREAAVEATSEDTPFCIAMGDVDHFKRFNDTWGHPIGDQVLRLVAQCFKSNVKGRDTAARFGGEEFVVILPGTSLEAAKPVANQIRTSVESKKIVNRASGASLGSITLSLGVAQWVAGEPVADLIARADACLYAAKRAGRNRVFSEREVGTAQPSADVSRQRDG